MLRVFNDTNAVRNSHACTVFVALLLKRGESYKVMKAQITELHSQSKQAFSRVTAGSGYIP